MKRLTLICLLIFIMPLTTLFSSSLQSTRLLIELHTSSADFEQELKQDYPTVKILQRFDTLLNGIAIEGRTHQLEQIIEHEAVKQAYPISTYTVTPETTQLIKRASLPTPEERSDTLASYTGKGVKVGVIDTGIDYTHPDLAPNYQGGYDLVDFDQDPMETLPEQGMPTIHGTHVAGIIGANGDVQGVAPDAELYGYRALGPGGVGTSVHVIAALEKAVNDGMDLINLSLGNQVNGPDYPTSLAVNRAIEHGVTIVIANGNSGPADWTVGSPATATDAISVGASTDIFQEPILQATHENRTIKIQPIAQTLSWNLTRDYPVVSGGLGYDQVPNASGKIVLFKRGEIAFGEKITQAKKANARAAIIYNDSDEQFEPGVDYEINFPAVFISQEDGEWLEEQLNERTSVWLNSSYLTHHNQVAHFSSRGPVTANWKIKPDLVAPGVDIISTIPDGYASLQGTSMAAPYVTGVLAVLKQAYPDATPAELKAAILTHATHLPGQQPIEQGMGQVDLEKTLTTPVLIKNSIINFGLITDRHDERTHELTITNQTDDSLSVQFQRPRLEPGLRWTLPATNHLQPNETKTIDLSLKIRPDQLATGMYQDYLTVLINQETYQLPYLFINQTATFPQIVGFELEQSVRNEHMYQLRLQIANTSDTLTIDLYDPATLTYLAQLHFEEEIDAGLFETTIDLSDIKRLDHYLINVSIQADDEITHFQHNLFK